MLLRNKKVVNYKLDMASNGSEVSRIDSQEDDVSDSQRQDVELSSQEELVTDKK
jgi:hypothetical protein